MAAMADLTDAKRGLRGGAFLFGDASSVFTPEQFAADDRLMIETAYNFCRREVLPILDRLDAQEDGLMESLVRKACELGFAACEAPERYGGLGLSKSLATRILEALSLNGSFSTTFGVHAGIAQSPITLFGSDDLREKYLPKLLSGEWMGAYALSEPNAGSDALSLQSKAERTSDGFRLTGTKMWISNAKWAHTFIVFARTEKGVTAFVVERSFPGVSVGPEEHKMGLKGSSTARLELDGALVPEGNLLYIEGEGHRVAFNALNLGRFKLAAMALGPARAALHHAAEYAKQRKQFGRPIAEFGLIREKLARCAAMIYAAESMLYRTGGIVDHAFHQVEDAAPDRVEQYRAAAEECAIEASIGKVFATETLALCADEALQIHGGYGFTEEFPVARIYRDARVTRIYEGTNEINRIFVTTRLVKKGILAALLDCAPADELHGLFLQSLRAAWEAKGEELLHDQRLCARLSDLAMNWYAVQSSTLRAAATDGPHAEFAQQCAELFREQAALAIAAAAAEVFGFCGRADAKVSLPATSASQADSIAQAVLESSGYPIL
jgi:alkylation response protein AidB-like acyl-CoA dehydrogenase